MPRSGIIELWCVSIFNSFAKFSLSGSSLYSTQWYTWVHIASYNIANISYFHTFSFCQSLRGEMKFLVIFTCILLIACETGLFFHTFFTHFFHAFLLLLFIGHSNVLYCELPINSSAHFSVRCYFYILNTDWYFEVLYIGKYLFLFLNIFCFTLLTGTFKKRNIEKVNSFIEL